MAMSEMATGLIAVGVTTRARRKAFEKDHLGMYEDLDRTVRLSVSLSNPDTAQEQLGAFFGLGSARRQSAKCAARRSGG